MNLTDNQKEIMNKYKINYDVDNIRELLINIDFVMTDYVDKNDNPTKDFKILEKLYDEIYKLKEDE